MATAGPYPIDINEDFSGSKVGLVLYQVLSLANDTQYAFKEAAEVENLMTSAERILFYGKLPHEAAVNSQAEKRPKESWPDEGSIIIQDMSLTYYKTDRPVLKQISLEVKSKEKIGVVGRTGAGKSSLVAALFRMTEPQGHIYIDGVRTADIGLHDLRAKISIIPQDPFLFNGSLRVNLDPFNSYSDDRIWEALNLSHLGNTVREMECGLETEIKEGGSNLSAGQKQLVCLARALLKRNKILILDEATANVDPFTDNVIQKTIREEFKDCTVLTIAHRLHTIIDSDRVLVLDKGVVKEFDTPWNLLQAKGMFYEMVQSTGSSTSEMLFASAKEGNYSGSRFQQT